MDNGKEPDRDPPSEKTEADKFEERTEKLLQVPKEELEEAKRKERERQEREKGG